MRFYEESQNYPSSSLKKASLNQNPFDQLVEWLKEAQIAEIPHFNAMILATATKEGLPSCRTVLLKDCEYSGLTFYTHYNSRKGKELTENPHGALLFFWKEQMRQITIEGTVEKLPEEISDAYFKQRARSSQIGAWASKQGTPLPSRKELEKEVKNAETHFQGTEEIPRPSYWGGFFLKPQRFEFWQGVSHRLHDRFEYLLKNNGWKLTRLSP